MFVSVLTGCVRMGTALWAVVLLFLPSACDAQGFGTWFEGRGIDIGVYRRDVHREFSGQGLCADREVRDNDWHTGGLFIRVSMASRFGLLVSGYTWKPYTTDQFPNRRYRTACMGAAFSAYPLVGERHRIGVTFSGSQRLSHDESQERYHKHSYSVMVVAHYERMAYLSNQRVTAWIAPAYISDGYHNHPYGDRGYAMRSRNDFGLVVGGNIAIAGHVKPYVQAIYANFWAPEFGISYQF